MIQCAKIIVGFMANVGNVFIKRLQTFFLFFNVFYVFNFFKSLLYLKVCYIYATSSVVQRSTIRDKNTQFNVFCLMYWASPAIRNHPVLPATQHRWTRPAFTPARQAGTRFTYPVGIEGWVDLDGSLYTESLCTVCPQTVAHPSTDGLIASEPTGSRTGDLFIVSRTPYRYAGKPCRAVWTVVEMCMGNIIIIIIIKAMRLTWYQCNSTPTPRCNTRG